MENYYYKFDSTGYDSTQINALRKDLKPLRIKELVPQLGGGADIGHQILLWFTLHYQDLVIGVAANGVTELIKNINRIIFQWNKKNKPTKKKKPLIFRGLRKKRPEKVILPSFGVHIYYEKSRKSQHLVLSIDHEYTVDELKKVLEKTIYIDG